jgi:hypothetical protein
MASAWGLVRVVTQLGDGVAVSRKVDRHAAVEPARAGATLDLRDAQDSLDRRRGGGQGHPRASDGTDRSASISGSLGAPRARPRLQQCGGDLSSQEAEARNGDHALSSRWLQ